MSDLPAAARRVLDAARRTEFERRGPLVVAAAALTIERNQPGEGWRGALAIEDRALRFVVFAGLAEAAGHSGKDRVERTAPLIEPDRRLSALAAAECLLARSDPIWSWALTAQMIGADPRSALLGLDIAAHAEFQGAASQLPTLTDGARFDVFDRQLVADCTARAAVRGELSSPADARLASLHENPPGRSLYPTEAASLLAAAARVDAAWALTVADGLLKTHEPGALAEAMRLIACAAVAAGLAARVVARASRAGFAAEQAEWTCAAAASGALTGAALRRQVSDLAPRVADELDPGRELVAGLPLLLAAGRAGEPTLLARLAEEWNAPPVLLITELFRDHSPVEIDALVESEPFATLLGRPDDAWSEEFYSRTCWWPSGSMSLEARRELCRAVLLLGQSRPWDRLPGSLADLVGWKPTC